MLVRLFNFTASSMASKLVICAVGIFFAEDAFLFCVQNSASIRKKFVHFITYSRPSIVRKIGSRLRWIQSRKFHIVWREGFSENSSTCKENIVSQSPCNCVESLFEDPKYSAQLETKVEELEKELMNLQKQVSKILQVHNNKIFDISEVSQSQGASSDNAVSSSSSIELRPPPPPPPLPPTPMIQTKLLVTRRKETNNMITEKDSVCSIMEELAKRPPKLRHVELTPGGRPVRKGLVPTDPTDILTAVLKKRFEATHSPIRYFNSSLDTTDSAFGY